VEGGLRRGNLTKIQDALFNWRLGVNPSKQFSSFRNGNGIFSGSDTSIFKDLPCANNFNDTASRLEKFKEGLSSLGIEEGALDSLKHAIDAKLSMGDAMPKRSDRVLEKCEGYVGREPYSTQVKALKAIISERMLFIANALLFSARWQNANNAYKAEFKIDMWDDCPVDLSSTHISAKSSDAFADFVKDMKVVDLTHPITHITPAHHSQGLSVVTVTQDWDHSMGVDFKVSEVGALKLNHGTHIDFPGHIRGTDSRLTPHQLVGQHPMECFVLEAKVFDAREKVRKFHTALKIDSGDDFIRYEEEFFKILFSQIEELSIGLDEFQSKVHGNLKNKAVLIYTGLSDRYKGFVEKPNVLSPYCFAPYVDSALAGFLVDSDVKILGVDSLQIENPIINFEKMSHQLPAAAKSIVNKKISELQSGCTHKTLLKNKVFILEHLTALDKLHGKTLLCCPPPKFEIPGCDDNSITRAFALVYV
jgi:kynurenine formamidase